MLRETLAVVMAGGRGSRLGSLTATRSKPAIPFAGKYRIIDFTLSNCINSGIRRISILTQYRAHSLIQHIGRGWSFCRAEFEEFIEVLPAQERVASSSWYLGTADAVYQNLDIIREHAPQYVLVLAGDHIYKMDYALMLATHIEHDADVTVGCVEVPIEQAKDFGVMVADKDGRLIDFQEKPENAKPVSKDRNVVLASMGIYFFGADFLYDVLGIDAMAADSTHDFGRDVIPSMYNDARVYVCPFLDLATGKQAYWRDVGTVDAYYEANLEIAGITPPLNLYDQDWPIRALQIQLPPAKFVFDDDDRRGMAVDSLVSAGCIVSGALVRRSLLSNNVHVGCCSEIIDSIILPDVRIGENCRIRRAIIDSGCHIPDGTVIGEDLGKDRLRFDVTPGKVVLVCPSMLGQSISYAI